MAQRARSRCSGMTLIELLVAMFVFVIASSGLLGFYLASHHLTEHAADTMQAVNDLEDIMERIYTTPFDVLQTRFPNGEVNGGAVNDYADIVGGYTLDDEEIIVTYTDQSTGRLEVLVTLNWNFRGRLRSSSLTTVRTRG